MPLEFPPPRLDHYGRFLCIENLVDKKPKQNKNKTQYVNLYFFTKFYIIINNGTLFSMHKNLIYVIVVTKYKKHSDWIVIKKVIQTW